MAIKVCVAGATGWTGSAVTKSVLLSPELQLVGAIARQNAGKDIGEVLGVKRTGVCVARSLEELIGKTAIDVLIDYTKPDSVKARTLLALDKGIRVVIGTSGLDASDFSDIQRFSEKKSLGVIASGNFSITAALAKYFSLIAAKHLPSWEIIEYAHADKVDAPSGTTRELAESLAQVRANKRSMETSIGYKEARGVNLAGTQVHSVRLPSFISAFETVFGLPNERLTIRHDSGNGADPYVQGTLLAVKKVMTVRGLIRGLDKILFE